MSGNGQGAGFIAAVGQAEPVALQLDQIAQPEGLGELDQQRDRHGDIHRVAVTHRLTGFSPRLGPLDQLFRQADQFHDGGGALER